MKILETLRSLFETKTIDEEIQLDDVCRLLDANSGIDSIYFKSEMKNITGYSMTGEYSHEYASHMMRRYLEPREHFPAGDYYFKARHQVFLHKLVNSERHTIDVESGLIMPNIFFERPNIKLVKLIQCAGTISYEVNGPQWFTYEQKLQELQSADLDK